MQGKQTEPGHHHKRLGSDLFPEINANNAKIHNLVRLWIYMVEARGVEPLSEGNATQVSTGVVTVLPSPGRSYNPDQNVPFQIPGLICLLHNKSP